MWIRSQDKTKLMNCEYFTVDNANVVIGMVSDNYKSLGTYSTEEKALKVLDMIQKLIKGKKETYYDFIEDKKIVNNYFYPNKEQMVFQMPQENEVE